MLRTYSMRDIIDLMARDMLQDGDKRNELEQSMRTEEEQAEWIMQQLPASWR